MLYSSFVHILDMTYTTLQTVFRPLIQITSILGMAPHKSVQGTLINTKTGGGFQIAFKITICVISLVVYFRDFYLEAQFGTFGNITLVRFVVTFRNTAITTLMVIILLSCLSSAKKIHLELTKIEQIDTDLAKMGQEITLSNRNCENRKSAIVLTWVIVLFAVIQAIYPYAFHIQTNYKQIFNVILNFYPRLVVGVRNIFFCLLLMVIKTRFNIINTILKNEIHLSKKNSKSNCNFYKKIKTLVDVHKTMVVVTEEVNSIFSLELLLWISITFVLLLVDVYSITHIVWFNLEENYALILKLLHNCVMYVFDLFLISITCARVCREVSESIDYWVFKFDFRPIVQRVWWLGSKSV